MFPTLKRGYTPKTPHLQIPAQVVKWCQTQRQPKKIPHHIRSCLVSIEGSPQIPQLEPPAQFAPKFITSPNLFMFRIHKESPKHPQIEFPAQVMACFTAST